jgi:hypothetical protein
MRSDLLPAVGRARLAVGAGAEPGGFSRPARRTRPTACPPGSLHLDLDEGGQLDVDRVVLPEHHVDVQVLLEVLQGVAHLFSGKGNLVVGLLIHEDELVAVLVEELHFLVLHLGLADLLPRTEGLVEHASRAQVLDLGAHECAALAGLHVLEIGDDERLPIDLDLQTVPELRSVDRHRDAPAVGGEY